VHEKEREKEEERGNRDLIDPYFFKGGSVSPDARTYMRGKAKKRDGKKKKGIERLPFVVPQFFIKANFRRKRVEKKGK